MGTNIYDFIVCKKIFFCNTLYYSFNDGTLADMVEKILIETILKLC